MFNLAAAVSRLRLHTSPSSILIGSPLTLVRHRTQLSPRKVKWVKRQKGVIPIPTGGSTKGTTLAFGEWGIRIKGNGARFSAKQLETVRELIKRKLKPIKGAKVYLRVFPDIPVCIKVSYDLRLLYFSFLPFSREMKHVWVKEKAPSNSGRPGVWNRLTPLCTKVKQISSRVPTGRVLFEIGGVPIREELARDSKSSCSIQFASPSDLPSSTAPS